MTVLGKALCERSAPGQHCGVIHALLKQVCGRVNAIDEADAERMLGIDPLARQHDLQCMSEADDLRQPYQTAVASVEAPFDILKSELRIGRAEADVACKCEFEAARDGVAVD